MTRKRRLPLSLLALAGLGVAYYIRQQRLAYADGSQVITKAKQALQECGKATGAWINLTPIRLSSKPYAPIFQGGVTVNEAGQTRRYDFVADALTGDLLQIKPHE